MQNTIKEAEYDKKRALWPFIKRIFIHSFQYKKWSYGLIITSIFVAVIDGLLPILWYRYIDDFITPTIVSFRETGENILGKDVYNILMIFAVIYLAIIVAQVIGMILFTYCAGRLKEYVIFDLRESMFAKLQQLPNAFYDRSALGWLSIRLTSDVDRVSEIISFGFVSLISGFMMITVSLIAMYSYNWQLATIVLVAIPLMVVLSIRIRMLILKYARQARRLYSHMAAYLTESFNGIEVNKATVHETKSTDDFKQISEQLRHASYRSAYYTAMYNPVIVLMGSIVAAAVIYFGGGLVLGGSSVFTIGLLAAFFGYARMIFEPIMEVTRFYASAQDSLSAGERIFSLIDEPVTIADSTYATDLGAIKGELIFDHVNFSYVEDKPVIQDLNLHIKAGESIALVGPTGEGKSTITNLICRFYEPSSGKILIDGEDYTTKTLKSYRQQLGIILQTAYLFSGTVRENILYGKLDATDDEIKDALSCIGAEEFIDRLDEEVGEEGNHLSGGEKQLISFARIILKNPNILIMDEATSSIDTIAEQKIQAGIASIVKERTSIIVAHRLSTIKNCDRILVIQKGRIIEEGNHAVLMKKKGFYHKLYTGQLVEV